MLLFLCVLLLFLLLLLLLLLLRNGSFCLRFLGSHDGLVGKSRDTGTHVHQENTSSIFIAVLSYLDYQP